MSGGRGEFVSLIVTHIEEDARTFWGQLYSPTVKSDIKCLTSALDRLAKSGKSCFEAFDPQKGEVFGSAYEDGSCYRCRVLFSVSKNKCLVQYIDYGNCEEKKKDCLIKLPPDFQVRKIPAMARRFRLHNIHIHSENIKDAHAYIEKMCSSSFVQARLVTPLSVAPTEIILYDEDSYDVGEFLIKSSIAMTTAEAQEKNSVILTSPAVSTAQKYRNPLLASSDESSDDYNNISHAPRPPSVRQPTSSSQSSGFDSVGAVDDHRTINKAPAAAVTCKNCNEMKSEMHKMRLCLMKTKHDLAEAEQEVEKLAKDEKYWRIKYTELKEQHNDVAEVSRTLQCNKEPRHDELDPIAPVSPKKEKISGDPATETPAKDYSVAMKRSVMPSLEFAKRLAAINKCVGDCRRCSDSLNIAVEKIKAHMSENKNLNENDFLSLIALRNGALQDLKQFLSSALPIVSTVDCDAVKIKIENFQMQLKKLTTGRRFSADNDEDQEVEIADIMKLIQEWRSKRENGSPIDAIVDSLLMCLSQKCAKYFGSLKFISQIPTVHYDIKAFQEQDKIIKEVKEENRSIRKRNQNVRIFVANLVNLEEDEKDADEKEKILLHAAIGKTKNELTECRRELQDSFEKKWGLMEILSEAAEKFCPELEIEHPELQLKEYIIGSGILMQGMMLDHFDISSSGWDDVLQLEYFYTTYRKEPIVLHKYPLQSATSKTWRTFLQELAAYSNVDCPHVIKPQGVFSEKGAAYVMIGNPCLSGKYLNENDLSTPAVVKNALKEIATALNALHEDGISHGQLSTRSILLSPKLTAYLQVPKFQISASAKGEDERKINLAKDVYHFGLLAKHLSTLFTQDESLMETIKFCLCSGDSNPASMKAVLLLL